MEGHFCLGGGKRGGGGGGLLFFIAFSYCGWRGRWAGRPILYSLHCPSRARCPWPAVESVAWAAAVTSGIRGRRLFNPLPLPPTARSALLGPVVWPRRPRWPATASNCQLWRAVACGSRGGCWASLRCCPLDPAAVKPMVGTAMPDTFTMRGPPLGPLAAATTAGKMQVATPWATAA